MTTIGARLAQGRTAEIYEWGAGSTHVLKLFRSGYERGSVEREQQRAWAVLESGVHAPAAGDIVSVNGRFGLIYERVRGTTILELLGRQPWRLVALAMRLAALHAEVHRYRPGTPPARLPSYRDVVRDRIEQIDYAASWREHALRQMDALPLGSALCHGDFHPGNVMLSGSGMVILDWNDAYVGHPLSDVARTLLLMRTGTLAPEKNITRLVLQSARRIFSAVYLRHYCRVTGQGGADLGRFGFVATVARMSEVDDAERAALTGEITRLAGDSAWAPPANTR